MRVVGWDSATLCNSFSASVLPTGDSSTETPQSNQAPAVTAAHPATATSQTTPPPDSPRTMVAEDHRFGVVQLRDLPHQLHVFAVADIPHKYRVIHAQRPQRRAVRLIAPALVAVADCFGGGRGWLGGRLGAVLGCHRSGGRASDGFSCCPIRERGLLGSPTAKRIVVVLLLPGADGCLSARMVTEGLRLLLLLLLRRGFCCCCNAQLDGRGRASKPLRFWLGGRVRGVGGNSNTALQRVEQNCCSAAALKRFPTKARLRFTKRCT